MKKYTKLWASLFCACLLSNVQAKQIGPEIMDRIQASSVVIEKENPLLEEEIKRDILDEQGDEKALSRRELPVKGLESADENEEEISQGLNHKIAAYYATSHRAAYHKPINISKDGAFIEMEDKSLWKVHGWDESKVKKWQPHHTFVIAPNKNIFTKGSYPFKLINLDNGDVVKAKMELTPVFNDPNIDIYVHWIEEIDYRNGYIRLEDGSLWSIAWNDRDMMRYFDAYNIVIVGTNDGWFRGSNPNILICVKNNAYIRGVVIN